MEEQIAKNSIMKNNHFFKYIRSRKLAQEAVGPLDNKGIKGLLKEETEFFMSVFTVENVRYIAMLGLLFLGTVSEEWSQV